MSDKEKLSLASEIPEENYIKGLPFTLDFKKMFEKTITSRFKSEEQDIIELTKLGIENSDSFVDVKENKNSFSVEFDGQGVSSEEDLVKLMLSLYSGKSEGEIKLKRFGTAITAALSKKPLEILVETHHDGDSICMVVDRSFKPKIYKPSQIVKNNKIIVVKRKPNIGTAFADTFHTMCWPVHGLVNKIKKSPNILRKRREKIAQIAEYTDKKVTYNGKQYNKGFKFENALFQEEYKIRESRILLSVPSKNYDNKTLSYLKNDIPICQHIISLWFDRWNRGSWDHEKDECIITPNILVSNPNLETNMSEDTIIKNGAFHKVQDDIETAKSRFYMDFLKGKFEIPNENELHWLSNEVIGRREFLKALFLTKIKNKNFKFSRIGEYVKNRDACLARLLDNEAEELKKFFSIKLFKDINGKTYAVPEIYKLIENDFKMFYFTSNRNVDSKHPAFEGQIDPNKKILLFESSNQIDLFKEIFPSRVLRIYEGCHVNKENISEDNPIILKNLDELVSSYYSKKREETERKIRKVQRIGVKTAKVAGGTAGGGVIIVGGYHAMPYLSSGAGYLWGGISAVAEFLFVQNPEIAAYAGGTGLAIYGTYKSAPYLHKGLVHLRRRGIFLAQQSMKAIGDGCRIVGKRCTSLEQNLDGMGEFVTGKTRGFSSKASEIWGGFTTYVIKKPLRSTLVFIGKNLTDIDEYLKERTRKAGEAKRAREEAKKAKKEEGKRKQIEILEALEKMKEEAKRDYCWKFGVRVEKKFETYFDYLIGYVQGGNIQYDYEIFSEIDGIEFVESYKRKPFGLKHHKDCHWLQINVSSNVLKNKVDAFYESGGRTLFADLQEVGDFIGKRLMRDTNFKARREKLDNKIINKLYNTELENILNMYKSSNENFNSTFESLGGEDKKYVLKRIIEDNSLNNDGSSLEKWLIDNYSALLEDVSEEMISKSSINLLKKTINNEEIHQSVQLFEKLTPNEKMKFISENCSPGRGESKSKDSLDAHIRANHPFLNLNTTLQQNYEKGIDLLPLPPAFYWENEVRELANAYRKGDNDIFNEILWPTRENKIIAPWSGNKSEVYLHCYANQGVLSDTKRAMEICLAAFYMLPEEERKGFLKKIRDEQFKNAYYGYFAETIKQYKPEYKEIFSQSDIII